jgi:hypothetical protein
MLITISAIMPSVFVVIPVVIAIIIAFARPNDAARDQPEQPQQEDAPLKSVRIYHLWTYVVGSTPCTMTGRNRFVGAPPHLRPTVRGGEEPKESRNGSWEYYNTHCLIRATGFEPTGCGAG